MNIPEKLNSFSNADSVFFSTIKAIRKLRDPWDKVDSPTSSDSKSLQQMVATPITYIAATRGEWGGEMLKINKL